MVTEDHVAFCFDVLSTHLNGQSDHPKPNFQNQKFPLFVTWKKQSHVDEPSLRGCIGNFSPLPLHDALKDYALISAIQDRRFDPIDIYELDELQCTVSLLTDFEPAAHAKDWEVGRHGIRISYTCPKSQRDYSATFLPEVAQEQGWDHESTLIALLRKSGYRGTINNGVLKSIEVTRYQSRTHTLTYQSYLEWKKNRS